MRKEITIALLTGISGLVVGVAGSLIAGEISAARNAKTLAQVEEIKRDQKQQIVQQQETIRAQKEDKARWCQSNAKRSPN